MKRIVLLITFLIITSLVAKENFSEMSTQELIAIMGYVKNENRKNFLRELDSRLSTMSPKEKRAYKKRLKAIREKRVHKKRLRK